MNKSRSLHISRGECSYGCGRKAALGRINCRECIDKNMDRNHKTRRLREKIGVCNICGKNKPIKGIKHCLMCKNKQQNKASIIHRNRLNSGLCVRCGENKHLVGIKHCIKCKNRDNIRRHLRDAKLKLDAMSHYCGGKPKCNCCKESEIGFLSIDHINGGGNQHRKSLGRMSFYRWLRDHDYPSGYQVLCMNCNWGSRMTGVCPHKAKSP